MLLAFDERLQFLEHVIQHVVFGQVGHRLSAIARSLSITRRPRARLDLPSTMGSISRRCRATARCSPPRLVRHQPHDPLGVNTVKDSRSPSGRSRSAGTAARRSVEELRVVRATPLRRFARVVRPRFAWPLDGFGEALAQTTEVSIRSHLSHAESSICAWSNPRSLSESRPCARRAVGGGVRHRAWRVGELQRGPTSLSIPASACSSSTIMSRAAICGSVKTSCRSRTEPHGTPAALSRSIQ